jgi:ferric-dicitrate binding protein FerR (iron transport regulator)
MLAAAAQAARKGDRDQARAILRILTNSYPDQLRAWMGLAELGEDDQERIHALEEVLRLQPSNQQAQAALDRLRPFAVQQPPAPFGQIDQPETSSDTYGEAPAKVAAYQAEELTPPVSVEGQPPASAADRQAGDYITPVLPEAHAADELANTSAVEEAPEPQVRRRSWLGPAFALALVLIALVLLLLILMPNVFRSDSQIADQPAQASPTTDLLTQATGQIPTIAQYAPSDINCGTRANAHGRAAYG